MKHLFTLSAICLSLLFMPGSISGQENPSPEEIQKWTAFATPSEGHKFLEKMTGQWSAELTMWPAVGAPPIKSKGESQAQMILGGRYLEQLYKGEYMGMPFEGRNLMAYDNHYKRIESIWLDSMGTGFLHGYGTLDMTKGVSSEKAETADILTGKTIKTRSITTIIGSDKILMEMYWEKEGEPEFKTMEIVYSRKK
jgi:hypothetical protein